MSKIKLFCLPYAGGSATQIYSWQKFINNDAIEVIPVELPGRGRRMGEKLQDQIASLVSDASEVITQHLTGEPYAIFGHSMGGLLAFEIVKQFKSQHKAAPKHLIISGTKLPESREEQYSQLDDEAFVEKIRALGGMSDEILENKEILNFFLPIIRADFTVVESYTKLYVDEKLDCKATLFQGSQDDYTDKKDILKWQDMFSEPIENHIFEGGHFFINEKKEEVIKKIVKIIS